MNCIFLIAEIYDFDNKDNKIWCVTNNADLSILKNENSKNLK